MAKLEMTDHCLAPETSLVLNYSGPDPWGVAKKISGAIRPFFHVSASGTSQTRVNWDVSGGENIRFYSTWWVRKRLSAFSIMRINIKIQGNKSKSTNRGDFWMEVEGFLDTNFEGASVLLRPFFILYSYLFYNRVRRDYIETCRNFILGFRNEVKEHFNLKATAVPRLRGSTG